MYKGYCVLGGIRGKAFGPTYLIWVENLHINLVLGGVHLVCATFVEVAMNFCINVLMLVSWASIIMVNTGSWLIHHVDRKSGA